MSPYRHRGCGQHLWQSPSPVCAVWRDRHDMSPATIKRIMLEVRQKRELVAEEARRAERHKGLHADVIRESFEYVGFWRALMAEAQRRLAASEDGRADETGSVPAPRSDFEGRSSCVSLVTPSTND
jgi:hypothetical protein